MSTERIDAFIQRWESSGAAERANYQLFLSELCDILDVPRPEPTVPDDTENLYVFERAVTFHHGDDTTSTGRIDLYKRDCFVLEAKQGAEPQEEEKALSQAVQAQRQRRRRGTAQRGTRAWDDAMLRARGQAEQYARALPAAEGRPPFLVVVDVGHSLELYSEFSRTGGNYVPFPDARSHRIFLRQLSDDDYRERLRLVWTDPMTLDPSRRTARVTQKIAEKLAELAKSLEGSGHAPETVATFLMRCLFTMFAEDVELLTKDSFVGLLKGLQPHPDHFVPVVEEVWSKMKTGGFSTALRETVLRFNGGLFDDCHALPLNKDQLALLLESAEADWHDVEPAIFGTLLERALDPHERHKLGAHYTPRAYVERLVIPTVIEPLREEWTGAKAAAVTLARQGKLTEAVLEIREFQHRLCHVRVLDPACGSGNFLYVVLEHLKRLEGEVFDTLRQFGERQNLLEVAGVTVDPHQLLGLEVNPRAAAIAELVLWIGYLQWHFRTHGRVNPPEPVIKNFHNIQCRDAVLEWDRIEPVLDEHGQPVTRWDGRTMKPHPVTGEEVPDETARVPVVRYINPRKASWPKVDFVVGNPPFIGNWRMRSALGEGYAEAVRNAHSSVPDSCDFVMYWWDHAAELARTLAIRRFGFITTNSLRQTFSRRVLQNHMAAKDPLGILFAIPDHPWVDSEDGAAVRIAMTVAEGGRRPGILARVVRESDRSSDVDQVELLNREGLIQPDLTIGADIAGAIPLKASEAISCPGVKLHGSGFIVTQEEAAHLGLGRVPGLEQHIRIYRNGRDLTAKPRGVMVIDLFGLSATDVQRQFPELYQWVLEKVKPDRDARAGATKDSTEYAAKWWVFGKPRQTLRVALQGLTRYIVTVETSRHRFFVFLKGAVLPDNMLVAIALDDAFHLGILSSRIHVTWALAAGGRLGVGNDPRYNKTRCFEPFPFPVASDEQKQRIRELGESLDGHRKRQQELYPGLTMTGMYNVLAKLRSGEPLTKKEHEIHEQGLISVLRQIHDELDAAVFAAYGWPTTLSDEEILEWLVALNAERAAEERRGLIRWLRPEFQKSGTAVQGELEIEEEEAVAKPKQAKPVKLSWPKALAEQAQAVRTALAMLGVPATPATLARSFKGARQDRVAELLETLASLGQARRLDNDRFLSQSS